MKGVKENECIQCGALIGAKSTWCHSCASKNIVRPKKVNTETIKDKKCALCDNLILRKSTWCGSCRSRMVRANQNTKPPRTQRKGPQIREQEGYRVFRPEQGWSQEWQAKQETQLMEIAQTYNAEITMVNKNLYRVTVPTG